MTDDDLIAALRKQVSAWFSNVHLLEFEELLRRYADRNQKLRISETLLELRTKQLQTAVEEHNDQGI